MTLTIKWAPNPFQFIQTVGFSILLHNPMWSLQLPPQCTVGSQVIRNEQAVKQDWAAEWLHWVKWHQSKQNCPWPWLVTPIRLCLCFDSSHCPVGGEVWFLLFYRVLWNPMCQIKYPVLCRNMLATIGNYHWENPVKHCYTVRSKPFTSTVFYHDSKDYMPVKLL
jgi:hypothetical protein